MRKNTEFTSIMVSKETKEKAREIAKATGKFQAEIVQELIDRRYKAEMKTKKIFTHKISQN